MKSIREDRERRRGMLDWFLIGVLVMSAITIGAALGHVFTNAAGLPFRAAASLGRFHPGPVSRMVVGAVVGLAALIAALYAARAFRRPPRPAQNEPVAAADDLGLSMLGGLGPIDRAVSTKLLDPADATAQPFSDLRQAVDFANLRHDARTIMLTGTGNPEARSRVVANLAVAFGRTGRRVVLVDADLERPVVHTLFDVNAAPGLRELVAGSTTLEASLHSLPLGGDLPLLSAASRSRLTPPGSLYVVTAGESSNGSGSTDGAGQVLHSPRVGELVSFLAGYFDMVLVAAPTSAAVGDAGLSDVVGGVVVVIEDELQSGAERSQLKRVLESIAAPKLGMIVAGASD